ncbi:deoxyribose-phosphate aldolase [Flavihumibacter rivuli]|uniref:deoxyribose-phosphate aldolase n=1 Tax=Flavihumibacter rivuli TaxID=2838156 RepID=UPI001BDE35DD|nr:deoxyribose-phosphate aldolase [Flavihumibacter rivuli]ULQ56625.1 deoxyribose-phosphate aldolase [Flavihumibacter rivuli]
MNIAGYIDHTILKPTTTIADIEKLCNESVEYGFAAVCVPPPFVKRAAAILAPTHVKVATVVGFPFGYSATEAKVAETILAIVDGAHEIDMVINLIALRQQDWSYLEKEVRLLVEVCHNKGKLLKVIIESGILTEGEIIACCQKLGPLGIDFMKTSTGYAEKGASVEAVELMRKHLPAGVRIKASGGIRDYAFASALVAAGAERLGCSASVAIVKGEPGHNTTGY